MSLNNRNQHRFIETPENFGSRVSIFDFKKPRVDPEKRGLSHPLASMEFFVPNLLGPKVSWKNLSVKNKAGKFGRLYPLVN